MHNISGVKRGQSEILEQSPAVKRSCVRDDEEEEEEEELTHSQRKLFLGFSFLITQRTKDDRHLGTVHTTLSLPLSLPLLPSIIPSLLPSHLAFLFPPFLNHPFIPSLLFSLFPIPSSPQSSLHPLPSLLPLSHSFLSSIIPSSSPFSSPSFPFLPLLNHPFILSLLFSLFPTPSSPQSSLHPLPSLLPLSHSFLSSIIPSSSPSPPPFNHPSPPSYIVYQLFYQALTIVFLSLSLSVATTPPNEQADKQQLLSQIRARMGRILETADQGVSP